MTSRLLPTLALALAVFATGCKDGEESSDSDTTVGTGSDTGDITIETDPLAAIHVEASSAINTVAIVTWPDGLGQGVAPSDIDDAHIEFGLGDALTHKVPVNVAADDMRTVVLGMKQGALTYSIRSTVVVGDKTYQSEVHRFETGYAPSDLLLPRETYRHASLPVEDGFVMMGVFANNSYAFVVDTEGDVVWWIKSDQIGDAGICDMALDWAGEFFYLVPTNPSFEERSYIRKVSVDGLVNERIDAGRAHHSVAAMPEGGVVFMDGTEDHCDRVNYLDPDGHITELFAIRELIDFPDGCHSNYVGYDVASDSFYVSVRNYDTAMLVSRDKRLLWAIGRDRYQTMDVEDFETGAEMDIVALHGLHMWEQGRRLLLFNNRNESTSVVYEYAFNEDFTDGEIVTTFEEPGLGSKQAGGVQRLPGGNTQVTYSTDSALVQFSPDGEVVHRLDFGYPVGYGRWRASLYGPPPQI